MIDAITKNLNRGITLLHSISDEQYSDNSVAPYFSSIGCHIRHILDVFNCVLNGYENGCVDLSIRNRNVCIEQDKKLGIQYFEDIISQLNAISNADLSKTISVIDNLGFGKETANYSLKGALMQSHSHAVHHYATIAYVIHHLGIDLPDSDFGFNATTPKKEILNHRV